MLMTKKKKFILILGSSGAGKTTLSNILARERDLAKLSEDDFVFSMNPRTMITRIPTKKDRILGLESLWASLEVYLKAGRSVVVEGAFVDGPYYLEDFEKLAKKYKYEFTPILLKGSVEKRRERKLRKGWAMPRQLDLRLRRSAEQLGYPQKCDVIDTTKRRTKQANVDEIERAIDK